MGTATWARVVAPFEPSEPGDLLLNTGDVVRYELCCVCKSCIALWCALPLVYHRCILICSVSIISTSATAVKATASLLSLLSAPKPGSSSAESGNAGAGSTGAIASPTSSNAAHRPAPIPEEAGYESETDDDDDDAGVDDLAADWVGQVFHVPAGASDGKAEFKAGPKGRFPSHVVEVITDPLDVAQLETKFRSYIRYDLLAPGGTCCGMSDSDDGHVIAHQAQGVRLADPCSASSPRSRDRCGGHGWHRWSGRWWCWSNHCEGLSTGQLFRHRVRPW